MVITVCPFCHHRHYHGRAKQPPGIEHASARVPHCHLPMHRLDELPDYLIWHNNEIDPNYPPPE